MKTRSCQIPYRGLLAQIVSIFLLSNFSSTAQIQPSNVNARPTGQYICVQRGPDSRVWQHAVVTTNATGIVRTNVHSYTELATGLCYLQNGRYVDSVEQIVPVAGGAEAVQGRHNVHWATDANTPGGAVTLTTPDGKRLRSTVFGLMYYDSSTGSNVLISQIQDSSGTIDGTSPNVLIYTNAFSNLTADIRYTYTKAGLSQDIILHQQPPPPADYGMNPATTWLQVITEFFNPPAPDITAATNEIIDDRRLNFGNMRMGVGHAFLLQNDNPRLEGIPVTKQWTNIDNRNFLIEEIPYKLISKSLQTLHTSVVKPHMEQVRRTAELGLPRREKTSSLGPGITVQVAKFRLKETGLVLDYEMFNSSTNNVTLQGDTTYLVTGMTFIPTLTIEGGTVVKYTNGTGVEVMPDNVVCQTAPYRPAVFTSIDDNSVGESIGSGQPSVNSSWYLYFQSNETNSLSLSNLRMSYAGRGIFGAVGSYTNDIQISDCQFFNCDTALYASLYSGTNSGFPITLNNVLFSRCTNCVYGDGVYSGYFSLSAANVTADQSAWFLAGGASNVCSVTNCIFTAVTNLTGVVSLERCVTNSNGMGIFQTVGGGGYYLVNASTNHGAGTTNIDPTLLADLAVKTTYPPIVMNSGWFTNDYTFFPQAERDNSGSAVDLGYHYDPIDYAVSFAISNAAATVLPGTVLAVTGTWGYGIWPYYEGSFNCNGTATSPVYLVRYNTVQEQSNTNWATGPTVFVYADLYSSSSVSASFHFTHWSALTGVDELLDAESGNFSPITLENCQLYGGYLYATDPALSVTNNLFERVMTFIADYNGSVTNSFCNNLFHAGELGYDHYSPGLWTFRDNLFDQTSITQWDSPVEISSNNAYVTTNFGLVLPTNAVVLLTNSPNYETGFLGEYYYPTNQTNLIFAGSRLASAAGLYHYTVTTNNVIDGTNRVSIGFHYVATDTNGVPLDSSEDGIPDYLADANGDGLANDGETNWAIAIQTQPQSQTVAVGSNVTFGVTATGVPTLGYQWSFNGTNIASATISTLTLTNAQMTNDGSYVVVISNFAGSITSAVATLNAIIIPQPVISPPPGVYALLQNVSITCSISGFSIRYTTDGTIPTASSPIVPTNSIVSVLNSETLKAAAFTNGASGLSAGGAYYIVGAIASGWDYAFYMNPFGAIYSWGDNIDGFLGDGTTNVAFSPVSVLDPASASEIFTCDGSGFALNQSEQTFGWGVDAGSLGTGTTNQSMQLAPVLTEVTNAVQLSIGGAHGLARTADGHVLSWGFNWNGQLGNGTLDPNNADPMPTIVPGISGVTAIGAGFDHSLAISNGLVYGWGDNSSGQLGDDPNPYEVSSVLIGGVANAIQVQGGASNSYALLSNGAVWAWGDNGLGELGIGTNLATNVPVQVIGLSNIALISACPDADYCLALTSNGTVWAWGANQNENWWFTAATCGQLGDGTCDSTNRPTMIAGLSNIVSVSAGADFAMALQDNGAIWAWGDNSVGELLGFNGSYTNAPIQIVPPNTALAAYPPPSLAPPYAAFKSSQIVTIRSIDSNSIINYTTNGIPPTTASSTISSGSTFQFTNSTILMAIDSDYGTNSAVVTGNYRKVVSAIGCGQSHIVSLIQDGTVVGWGDNSDGQIGADAQGSTSQPLPITGLSNIVAVAAGAFHSLALDSNGHVWAWGDNSDGQLGGVTQLQSDSPILVGSISNIAIVAGGFSNSLAIASNGTVWAWGNNSFGQLGVGDALQHFAPVQVIGITNALAVAAGASHSLALLSNGMVLAWGDNSGGQLGIGSTTSTNAPVQISALSNIVAIAAGEMNSFAVDSSNTVWAWGKAALGDGHNSQSSDVPIIVSNLNAFTISANGYSAGGSFYPVTLALSTNGSVMTWGNNQIAATPTYLQSPTNVGFLPSTAPLQLAAGGTFSAALMPDLSVYVWGQGSGSVPGLSGSGVADIIDDWDAAGLYIPSNYYAAGLPTLTIQSGDGQYAAPNSYFSNALVVKVNDSLGNPLVNAPITFDGGTSGILLSFSQNSGAWPKLLVTTDASGCATAWAYESIVSQLTNSVVASARDGTNAVSVVFDLLTPYPGYLAHWRFSGSNWYGEEGQQPLVTNYVIPSPGLNEFAAQISNNDAVLEYNLIESNGTINFTPMWGSVEFWFRPSWASVSVGGVGPGVPACLMEAGMSASPTASNWWRLGISSNGNQLVLDTMANGVSNNNLTASIQLSSNQWHMVTVTYNQSTAACYLDGHWVTNGPGVPGSFGLTTFTNFRFGNSSGYGEPAEGEFEEIKTFSVPMTAGAVSNDYNQGELYPNLANSMACWLRPDVLVALTNNAPVSNWLDSSGNGNNATQINSNNMPVLGTNLANALPAVQFLGSNSLNLSNFATAWTQGEIFIVHQVAQSNLSPVLGSGAGFWTFGASGAETYYPFNDGTNIIIDDFGSTARHSIVPIYPMGQFEIYNASSTTNQWAATIGGLPVYSTNSNTVAFPTNLILGASQYAISNISFFKGDIAEVLVYDRTLSTVERDDVQMYLQSKYLAIPSTPGPLTANPLSSSQVQLFWPANAQPQDITYVLERESPTNAFEQIGSLFGTNSYVDSGLNPGVTYTYRLQATNYAGASGYSGEVTATTFLAGNEVPLDQVDLWYDGTTLGVFMGLTNNAPVMTWPDASGFRASAVLNSGNPDASDPVFITNVLNGKPIVRFSDSRYFGLPGFLGTNNEAELFAVLRVATNAPTFPQNAWELGGSPTYWDPVSEDYVDFTYYPDTDGSIADDFASTSAYDLGFQPISQFHLLNIDGADGDWEARINGSTIYTTDQNTFAYAQSRTLGGGLNPFSGDIAELLTFNRQLTATERQAVEEYLNGKYGIFGTSINFTQIEANALSTSQIILTWDTDANTNFDITYVLNRKEGSNGTFAVIANLTNISGYQDSGLAAGAQYYYQIQASSADGLSSYSPEVSAMTFTNIVTLPQGGLALWLKADALGGFTNGEPVPDWPDQSGWHNDAIATNVLNQPVFESNVVNGEPAILFNGTNSYFALPNFGSNFIQGEMFMVVEAASNASTSSGSWKFGNSPGTNAFPNSTGAIVEDFGSTTGFEASPFENLSQFNLYDVAADTNGNLTAWLNGVNFFMGQGNSFAMTINPTIGTSTNSFAGAIAELLIFNTVLSDTQRTAVQTFFNQKYQLLPSLNAPSNLTATAVSSNQISLTWDADYSGFSTTYYVDRSTSSNGPYSPAGAVVDSQSFFDIGVTAGADYYYRIMASNQLGSSPFSIPANVITPSTGTAIPLGNLKLWLKADAGCGPNPGLINQWLDQSGNTNNATQVSFTNMPSLVYSALNGRPVVHFSAGNEAYFSLSDFMSNATAGQAFVVLRAMTGLPITNRCLWSFGAGSGTGYPLTGGQIQDDFGRNGGLLAGTPLVPINQYHLYSTLSQSNQWTSWIDGVMQYSTTSNTPDFMPSYSGEPSIGSGPLGFFDGDIAEIMLFSRALTSSEQTAVQNYLNAKYDVVPASAPSAPSGLMAMTISANDIALNWSFPQANWNTAFLIQRSADGTNFSQINVINQNTSFTDTGLTPGTEYYYQIVATNIAGVSSNSSIVNATTLTTSNALIMSNLVLWLRADAGVQTTTNTANVTNWLDQTTNHFNAINSSGGNWPALTTNVLNGYPVIHFNSAQTTWLKLASFPTSGTGAEGFIILRSANTNVGSSQTVWTFGGNGNNGLNYPFINSADTNNMGVLMDDFGSQNTFMFNEGLALFPLTQFNLYNVSCQGTQWTSRLNGIVQYRATNNSFGFPSSATIGNTGEGDAQPFDGDIAEILVYNRALTASERRSVGIYLNEKYGCIASNAPPVPTGLTAWPISSNQISLTWNVALTNSGTTYLIQRGSDGITFSNVAQVDDSFSYIDRGLSADTGYFYQICATNYAGGSAQSAAAGATTFASADGLPFDSLKLWLKADVWNNGGLCVWLDQTTNQNDAYQTAYNYSVPQFVEGAINSRPAVRFSSTSGSVYQYYTLPTVLPTNSPAGEAFVVVRAMTNGGLWTFGYDGLGTEYPDLTNDIEDGFGVLSGTAFSTGSPVLPITQFVVYHVTSQSNLWGSWINGISQFTTSNNMVGFPTSPLLGDALDYPFNGEIAELLVFNRGLQTDEQGAVETYLTTKYFSSNSPPYVIAAPSNQTILQGQSATLAVRMGGAEPLSYQWQFNGQNIVDATQSVFSFNNFQSVNAGTYSVTAVNAFGSVTSPCQLVMAVPPWITTEPASQDVALGETATFAVSAAGPGPLSYQWQFSGTTITGATQSAFTITSAQLTNAGNYAVVVSNPGGNIVSVDAGLTIEVAPTISVQPQSQSNNAGTNVMFNVAAAGTPPLYYQWEFNGTNLTGATNSGYCISGIQATNAGTYSVLVTNLAGSLLSSNAILTVNALDTNGLPDYWETAYFGSLGVNPLADPDYDGRNNLQEYEDGTDPVDPSSVLSVMLGYWRFSDTNWIGQEGQAPLLATNLQIVSTFSGNGVLINSTNPACLTYHDVETNGLANINCRNGAVVFWVQPAWNGGSGPGNIGRLIEMGDTNSSNGWWSLWVDATGSTVTFQSQSNNILTTYLTNSIFGWTSNNFYQIALTYSPTQTSLFTNGVLAATGPGMTNYPNLSIRSTYGFTLGSDRTGELQFRGTFDEFQTFNASLSSSEISAIYESIAGPGGNGLAGYINWVEGWNPFASGVVPDTNGLVNLLVYTPLH